MRSSVKPDRIADTMDGALVICGYFPEYETRIKNARLAGLGRHRACLFRLAMPVRAIKYFLIQR